MSRHELDVTSLMFGLVFAVLGGSFLVAEANDADVDLTWLLSATLLAVGAVAVTVGVARAVRQRPAPAEDPDGAGDGAGPGAGGDRMVDEIRKAKELLDSGAITDAEFQEMKAKILGRA